MVESGWNCSETALKLLWNGRLENGTAIGLDSFLIYSFHFLFFFNWKIFWSVLFSGYSFVTEWVGNGTETTLRLLWIHAVMRLDNNQRWWIISSTYGNAGAISLPPFLFHQCQPIQSSFRAVSGRFQGRCHSVSIQSVIAIVQAIYDSSPEQFQSIFRAVSEQFSQQSLGRVCLAAIPVAKSQNQIKASLSK